MMLLIDFLYWYLLSFARTYLRGYKNFLWFLEEELAIVLHARLLFVPLFGDYSRTGRVLSVIFRIGRVIFGSLIWLTTSLVLILPLSAWYFWPVLILKYEFLIIFLPLVLTIYLFKERKDQASRGQPLGEKEIKEVLMRLGIEDKRLVEAFLKEAKADPLALASYDLNENDWRETAAWVLRLKKRQKSPWFWDEEFRVSAGAGVNRALTSRPTPVLDEISLDLTGEAARGKLPEVFGRREVVEQMLRVLSRAERENVLLLGEPGCGKTTLVGGLAKKIVFGTENLPESVRDKRIVSLSVGALFAGVGAGVWEKRIMTMIKEIEAAGNIILFIDNIHELGRSEKGELSALSILEPHLASSHFQVIGATNYENYRKFIEPNEAVARVFQIVEVPEATREETKEILKIEAWVLEKRHGVLISWPAIKRTVELSAKLIHDRVLPDKALGVLDEASVLAKAENRQRLVTREHVERVVAEKTHIPVEAIKQEEAALLLNLEKKLHQRIVNQEEAIKAISSAMRRARTGLTAGNRPKGSFLFVGPTGVGKTETAKALAEIYFGDVAAMIRLDMGQFSEEQSLYSLIGSPPGGGEKILGQLTEPVRQRPFSLILLDEFEKAHSNILNLFLPVLEDGRLRDSLGREIDFSQNIIIATSNAGTEIISQGLKEGKEIKEIQEEIYEILQQSLKIELLNRFDGIILYQPLTKEHLEEIVRLMLKKVSEEMMKRDIEVLFKESLIRQLAERGHDPVLGARPLRRLVSDKVESFLAGELLAGKIKRGGKISLDERVLD